MWKVCGNPKHRAKPTELLCAVLLIVLCASFMIMTRSSGQSGNVDRLARLEPARFAQVHTQSAGVSRRGQSGQYLLYKRADDTEKLEPALLALMRSGHLSAGEDVPVIIQFADEKAAKDFDRGAASPDGEEAAVQDRAEVIRSTGGMIARTYSNLPELPARVSQTVLESLAGDPRIARISLDHPIQSQLNHTVPAIGADLAWANAGFVKGVTGKGITVAVIDSGVGANPITSNSDLAGKVIYAGEFLAKDTDKSDLFGHGTHVGGIIAGSGHVSASFPGFPGVYEGIAPDAKLISLRVLDSLGAGQTSDVIAALDWCLQYQNRYGIDVINLSLGHPVYESYKTDPLCRAVEACVKAGMVVVVAAGNYGKDANGPVYGGISSPGNDPAAITVGAMDTMGTDQRSDDQMASYSSRGPTAIDGLIKPDVVAPGNKISLDSANVELSVSDLS